MKIDKLHRLIFTAAGCLLVIFILGCNESTPPAIITQEKMLLVPKGFPEPIFPENNPYSEAKALLGRYLFYEKVLSPDSTVTSCSHCHIQANAFGGNTIVAVGYHENAMSRNALSHQNVVYRKLLLWDGRETSLEHDAYGSISSPFLIAGDTNVMVSRLKADSVYIRLFKAAFGDDVQISATLIAKAIATFQRTLISGNSPYDKYLNGDLSALSPGQIRGMKLFSSDRANCSKCHSGLMFTDAKFHNTGFVTHYFDRGLFEVTKKDYDRGKFLTPTLRNIEATAPYMHNGEFATLDEVLNHYNHGGRSIVLKDTLIKALNLSQQEINDLIDFLKSLTDKEFLTNKKFSDPKKF